VKLFRLRKEPSQRSQFSYQSSKIWGSLSQEEREKAFIKIRKILSKIDFSRWWGIGRKEIEWYPTIDEDKCIGCGMCITTCGRGVFEFDKDKNKSKVKNPYNCMVGCDNCSIYCPAGAISFPQKDRREFIQSLLKKYNLIAKARENITKEGSDEK